MTSADDTVVIAVGIDFPDGGPLWATSGLARRALNFAKLASGRGVSKHAIFLMVDGDHEVVDEGERPDSVVGSVWRPQRNDFKGLVAAARKMNRGSVVVYWAGHGAVGRDDDRCLLFADAATSGQCIVDTELMAYLMAGATTGDESPFDRMMLIADVCANYDLSLTDTPLRSTNGKFDSNFERVALYATAKGSYASPSSGFSAAIMNWLRSLPISEWWNIRLDEVKGLYDALLADAKGQQPFAVYVHTRDGDELLDHRSLPRLKPTDLPFEPFRAYRIDPRKTDPQWRPWEANPVPLGEQAMVRLDVIFTARRAVFRAMVIEHDDGSSFVGALASMRFPPADPDVRETPVKARDWQILNDVALRGLNIVSGSDLRARLKPNGASDAVPTGVLLPVRDPDYEVDWGNVWPVLDAIFPDSTVVVALVAGSTLEGVHTAVAAAERAADRHVVVEVYSRSVPTGPVGIVAADTRFDRDPLAGILSEISARRAILSTRGAGVLRDPVVPHIVPARIVGEVVEALNRGSHDAAKEVALLRDIREALSELWPVVIEDYATKRSTPGWVHGLVVAAEIRADLTRFLGALVARSDGALQAPNSLAGWLTTPLIDQVGMEMWHLTEKGGSTPGRKPAVERAWRLWRQRMTPAVRDAIEQKAMADWDMLTPQQLVMLTRHGFPVPESAQDGNEIARWVTVAQSPATEKLAQISGTNLAAFAAAVFDEEEPQLSDPERAIRLAGIRHAVHPRP